MKAGAEKDEGGKPGTLRHVAGPVLRPLQASLSFRLLVMTVLFVMLAEVMIFVPSIANFRKTWLDQRAAAAQIASLSLEATPDNMVSPELREELLRNAQIFLVVLHRTDTRKLLLSESMPPKVDTYYDLQKATAFSLVVDAFETLLAKDGRTIRVMSKPNHSAGESIEIVLDETPLRSAMLHYGANIFWLSLVISVITAGLVYLALHVLMVRPMRRITHHMVSFRQNPEDARRVILPSGRLDEIGVAERELAAMQSEIRATLNQKARLAALGGAVSKINHDLRNILASVQLISDRLGAVDDPTVQKLAPRLFSSIDRAIQLCTDTLKFGRAKEELPQRRRFRLASFANEIAEASIPEKLGIGWIDHVPDDLEIDADPDQLFRVLLNLVRNATQALGERGRVGGEIRLTAQRCQDHVHIYLSDNGPGLPEKAKAHLFEPFSGSARAGGSGLGLAIADELVRAHGGHIGLLKSDASGTVFRICIPDGGGSDVDCDEAEDICGHTAGGTVHK
ncbi:HAMP domain-containing sensor histidine kinase [Parvibaculum sp.]|uniref:sensor histidine kinase n=1 Tax=Parvibaculum sp. TaxID=2024848 RepID=UPI000C95D166|nr:HAMP domain-containing sensor histidine kinase [Parvibaculum sp.]MAB12995.1 histidine kinase [Parvibaculum sp.]